ncbi:FecCD family ABC transporter permease [Streptomyces sp. NRRL F-2664]|uniref:FecCD family ABC transporter permease n=1 Tax=Streptomyces sp. NRRL F-2664 TaxID=1463842 RepID=UPI000A862629|nr:iron ABC transporter permease [Streptomyces sp. NRRL F-2664]
MTLAVLALLCAASLALGTKSIPPDRLLDLLLHPDGSEESGIIHRMRVPRTEFGLVVGAALGVSGALMQGLTRNPLADPGLLGVSAGASLGVVVGTGLLGVTAVHGFVWFAFAGALLTIALVYALGAAGRGGATPAKLALSGAAMSALLLSLVNAVLLFDAAALGDFRFWAVGSLTGQPAEVLAGVLPFLGAGALLAASTAPALNKLALGDGVATALGQNVGRVRIRGAAAVTLLAGGAVALCGPIAFIGLVIPHIARRLAGPDHRWIVVHSALLGPCLLIAADLVGRLIARPDELHVGIVVTAVGAPFFILSVRRRRLREL